MSVGPKQSHLRGHLGATRGISIRSPYVVFIRFALRTRYAAPIGIVGTSGGLAGFVLPFSNVLCEEFRKYFGLSRGCGFPMEFPRKSRDSWSRLFPRRVVSLWWMSWSTPAGLNLSESRARGYVATWKLCLTPGHSKLEVNSNKIHQLCA